MSLPQKLGCKDHEVESAIDDLTDALNEEIKRRELAESNLKACELSLALAISEIEKHKSQNLELARRCKSLRQLIIKQGRKR